MKGRHSRVIYFIVTDYVNDGFFSISEIGKEDRKKYVRPVSFDSERQQVVQEGIQPTKSIKGVLRLAGDVSYSVTSSANNVL